MASGTYLLDTGFIVALLDARDPDHAACRALWKTLRGKFVTVEGVLVETAHLLRRNEGAFANAVALLEAVDTEVLAPTATWYARALELMHHYRNVPMDFVDALLVCVAEERSLHCVLTLDHRGFVTYRIRGRKRFTILPEP